MLKYIFLFFKNYKNYGKISRELNALTDRELKDIGINRSDIPRIAANRSL